MIETRLRALLAASAFLLAGCQPPQAAENKGSVPVGSGFDFYVLSLSWSPSYCEAEGEQANRQQCNRRDPHGFVVHGLWPQFERGYPDSCRSDEPQRVPNNLVDDYRDVIPSAGLIGHQWRKHGTCSGLSQADYLETTRMARDRIKIPGDLEGSQSIAPQAIEDAFIAANPGLNAESMAVSCDAGLIREVRICLTKDNLDFRACPEIDRRGCSRAAQMPEPR